MIQLGSIIKVTDKTCVVLAQCIKIPGPKKKKNCLYWWYYFGFSSMDKSS